MRIDIRSIELTSGIVRITAAVIGGPGHEFDCAGLELGTLDISWPIGQDLDSLVARIRERAHAVYDDGYRVWELRNLLTPRLEEPP